jgi:ankyrin repeat protein
MGAVQSIASQRPGLVAVLSSGAVGVASAALAAFQQECFYHEVSTPATRLVEQQHLEPTFFGWGTARLVTEWKEESYDVFESELDPNRVLAFSVASLALSALVGVLVFTCSKAGRQAAATEPSTPQSCDLEESEEAEVSEDAEASIDLGNERDWTRFKQAISQGNAAEVESLVERGANVNYVEPEEWIAIKDSSEVTRYFQRVFPHSTRLTPLCEAVSKGKSAMVRLLVKLKADVNLIDSFGGTPLQRAVIEGDADMVRLLVDELGAEVNLTDEKWTPAYPIATAAALDRNKSDMLRLLADRGADLSFLSTKDFLGWSPLERVVDRGDTEMLRLLVELGADLSCLSAEDLYRCPGDVRELFDSLSRSKELFCL